jgi:hypothetical protein
MCSICGIGGHGHTMRHERFLGLLVRACLLESQLLIQSAGLMRSSLCIPKRQTGNIESVKQVGRFGLFMMQK